MAERARLAAEVNAASEVSKQFKLDHSDMTAEAKRSMRWTHRRLRLQAEEGDEEEEEDYRVGTYDCEDGVDEKQVDGAHLLQPLPLQSSTDPIHIPQLQLEPHSNSNNTDNNVGVTPSNPSHPSPNPTVASSPPSGVFQPDLLYSPRLIRLAELSEQFSPRTKAKEQSLSARKKY